MPYPVSAARGHTVVPLTYANKVLGIATASQIGYWPLWETSGTTADNYQGVAARDGTYSNVTLAASTFTNGNPAGSWDGLLSYCNIYSDSLRDAFSSAAGTLAIWGKVSGSGVWTDGVARRLIVLRVDANNLIRIGRTTTNNQLECIMIAGGTSKQRAITYSDTGWFHAAITWSVAADEVKAYLNGVQQGATATGLGTWAGSLASTTTIIGSASTVVTNVWSGNLVHGAVWTTALTAAQVLSLATVP